MRTLEVKECQKTINDYFMKGGFAEVQNGNTPSPLSPTSSVGSQVSTRGFLNMTTPIGLTFLLPFSTSLAELWLEYAAVFSGADYGARCISTSEHVPELPDHVSRAVGNGRRDGDQGESHRFVSQADTPSDQSNSAFPLRFLHRARSGEWPDHAAQLVEQSCEVHSVWTAKAEANVIQLQSTVRSHRRHDITGPRAYWFSLEHHTHTHTHDEIIHIKSPRSQSTMI